MADNTIANAIKFLKGEEKSLPAAKTEGQVYFAYKNVGTAEKPSYTGAIYIDTPIGGTQNRIKMTANADIADKAFNDSAGLNIRDTYLSGLGYTDDGKQTILIKGSGNNQTRIALPIASTAKSGIVTTDAQSFGGTKTFTTINSTNLTVTGSSGFSYTGIETATGDKARPVWFAYDGINGKPVVNTNFTYNPATQTLKVANLSGTADKANKDNAGNDIRSTYINNITINNDIMTITKGSGATSTLSIKDKLYGCAMMVTKEGLDKFIEANVFKFGHINGIEGYNGLENNDGIILSASWDSSTNYGHQILIDDNGYALRHRYRNSGTWSDWASILDSTNYNSYAPTKAGGGAYGTWDINILGNAASANKLNTNAGSATFPVYFSNGVPVACSTNLAVNAASATRLTSNAGSIIQPIYFKDGKPIATTYFLNAHVQAFSGDLSTGGWKKMNGNVNGSYITVGYNGNSAIWNSERYSSSIVFGTFDTKGLLDCGYYTPIVTFGGGSSGISTNDNPAWYFKLSGTSGQTYTFPVTSKTLAASDGSNASGTDWGISITGKSASTDALNWTYGNEIRFTKPNYTEPQPLHFGWAWTDNSKVKLISEYAFDGGDGHLTQVSASQFNGNLNGNATGLTDATGGSNTIKVGWNGDGLTSSKIHSLAAYSTDAVLIKDAPKSAVREWLGPMPASDVYAWAKASTKPVYTWGEINGKPSTFTPSSHTHYSLSTIGDQRSTATTPNSYSSTFVFQGLKYNSTIGITSTNTYSYVLGLRGWNDSSGGDSHELAFNGNLGILTRSGATTWNAWRRILDSSNYTEYTVTKTGSGASGTWGINVSGSSTSCSGNAASATTISSMTPTLSTGIEESAITVKTNDNAVFPITDVAILSSIRTAIDFQWYDSNWQIGNIRSDFTDSVGFGFAFKPSANGTLALKSYIDTNGVYHGNVTGSAGSVAWGNISGKPSSFNPSSHTHPYLPLAGGTMTGTINFNGDTLACNFRSNASDYCTGIMHQTNGNEALMFAAANAVTSFIFKCGQNPVGMTSSTWTGITPSMQIKKQSVYINSLIANNVTPGYNLYVNGTTRCNGTLGIGNGSSAEIDFFPNSSSTIGARIKAYSDRIEFVFS